jgi:hypothetical protein
MNSVNMRRRMYLSIIFMPPEPTVARSLWSRLEPHMLKTQGKLG